MTDVNTVDKPVEVYRSQGTIDAVTASFRYLTVIVLAIPAILGFLENRDIFGLIEWVRSNDGATVIAALGALATAGYGIFKTFFRGAQMATVAASTRVPNSVAKISK
jgi:hypothetical protein